MGLGKSHEIAFKYDSSEGFSMSVSQEALYNTLFTEWDKMI